MSCSRRTRTSTAASRKGRSLVYGPMRTLSMPCTRIRIVPSGMRTMRCTTAAVPIWRNAWVGAVALTSLGRAVDERQHAVEIGVAHVKHVGAGPVDQGIAVGMGARNMDGAHFLAHLNVVGIGAVPEHGGWRARKYPRVIHPVLVAVEVPDDVLHFFLGRRAHTATTP